MSVPIWALLPAAIGIVACSMTEMPDASEGAVLFAANCTGCHGVNATGIGKAPDLTRIAARNQGVFPVAPVLSQIDGYGRGSAGSAMPEFGDLLLGDTVPVSVNGTLTPTPRGLAALLAYLQAIQAL